MTERHESPSTDRIGWVGLGAMGLPMASVLLAERVPLTVYDVNSGAAARAEQRGAVPARHAAEAADGADVLVIMVATPDQLEDVLFGAGAASSALSDGAVVLVTSTVGPAAIERTAERLAARGVQVVDAPVSGGVARATAGDLLFMVSGPATARARVTPLLELMARDVFEFSERPGDGQRVKLVNQLLCGIHIAAAAEALAYAESLGLDARACYAAIRTGAAASFMLDDRGQRMLDPTDEVRSALSIFVKDLGLVIDAGARHDAVTELTATALAMFEDGAASGLGHLDDSELITRLRERSRTSVDR